MSDPSTSSESAATGSAREAVEFPDAEYLVLSSRLIPDLDGGYTIATLSRAKQLAAAGVADGAGPVLLTFDPGDAATHAEHRATFARRGAIAEPARMRNLFDEAAAPTGGAAEWLRAAADPALSAADGIEYRVLRDAQGRPYAALPVIAANPDWHLTEEPVLVYDETGQVIGGLAGFRALYNTWLRVITSAFAHDRPIAVICESRQLGELIADWDDPRVRIIHTIHTMHLEPPYTPDAPMNALWTRWFALADRFDAVAWPTQTQRDDVVARFGDNGRAAVVPNVVSAVDSRKAEQEPGLVVVLGRLAPGKRIDHAIRAFVAADVPGSRMEIWGGGAEHDRLAALIDELGARSRIMLAGYTDDPGRVLDRASVVVTSTAFEGQPLSIVESLMHGTPVVSYDVRYGIRDVLGDGGGILVPDGDEQSLCDALRQVLTDSALHARLVAEAPVAASAWSSERAVRALADAVRGALTAAPRR
ncbi:glycosyltransferase [Microbacterium sp.]|uniref:glycosyltransferase n=1 Tax=Microbacterium sp. TaxID=51671 RepID=UPI002605EE4C|nr:glycosyltransferase [Microbacterium sp.]